MILSAYGFCHGERNRNESMEAAEANRINFMEEKGRKIQTPS